MPESTHSPSPDTKPKLVLEQDKAIVSGAWTFTGLASRRAELKEHLQTAKAQHWDLRSLTQLDSSGALLFWQAWEQKLPAHLEASNEQKSLFEAIQASQEQREDKEAAAQTVATAPANIISMVGQTVLALGPLFRGILQVFGRVILACGYLITHPRDFPAKELSASIFHAGVRALGITAIVGFLIGIVLSYLSAQQLAQYGANILIVDLLGISIVRELAPLLAAILVAGRSGSAITAQLGIMKISQELDAMSVLGLSHTLRIAWPKVVSLVIIMPLLALWTDVLALFGGMLAAEWKLGLSLSQFMARLPTAVDVHHVWIGLGKSLAFGGIIGLIACHFGFSVDSNSESLGKATTSSVVSSITLVILADAFFAIIFSMPPGAQ